MRKLKKIAIVAMSVLTLLSFTACGSKSSKKADLPTLAAPAEGTAIEGTDYTLNLPDSWVDGSSLSSLNSSTAQADLIICCTETAGSEDFAENINVMRSKSASGVTLSQYKEQVLKQYKSTTGFEVEGTTDCSVSGNEAFALVSKVTQSGITYKCKQVCFIAGDYVYVITYAGDTDGGYDEKESEANAIIASFTKK